MTEINALQEYVIAPQHGRDLAVLDPYIIEGVAYSPNKMTYLCGAYDDTQEVYCNRCGWETTAGELPYDSGYVQPDLCPECAKEGELGFVRKRHSHGQMEVSEEKRV